MGFFPDKDGETHINVYSKGKTWLGRQLSNFAHTPFKIEPYGTFQSVEGFWYWLATGRNHHYLQDLYGWEAKREGRWLKKEYGEERVEGFESFIKSALRCKIEQHEDIRQALSLSELPLAHYYVVKDKQTGVETPKYLPQYNWIVEELEQIRREVKDVY